MDGKMVDNYEQLVERISSSAEMKAEEIERRVEAKRAKLSGLVSKEGAAQIVAAELGINFERERMKIGQLVHGMRRANVLGKIVEIGPVRNFNKNGKEGSVANLMIADESSNIKVVFWDTNHISLIEDGSLKEGDVIEVSGAGIRNGEMHLSSFSDVKVSGEKIGSVVTQRVYGERSLKDVKPGESLQVRATIVQSFEPRYFEVNAKTGRKPTEQDKTSGAEIEKRALLNVVLDDGTETLRAVIFGNEIKKLGLNDEEIFDLGKFNGKKDDIMGEEMIFCGNLRQNKMFNTTEMTIESIRNIDVEELVKELESKSA
jgi:hypothetical protein